MTPCVLFSDRGAIARVDKSYAVHLAGGVGMIHANTGPSSLNADLNSVPTAHVDHIDGGAITTYVTTDASPTAQIFPSVFASAEAPLIAAFSSRGPLQGSGNFTSAEQVNFLFLPPTTLYVGVHGWQTDGPDADYTLFDWSVSATPGGSLSIDSAPAAAVTTETGTIDVSWAGLGVDMKYLGAVSHSNNVGLIGLTLISVETD